VHKINQTISKLFIDFVEILFISASIVLLTFLFLAQPLVVTGDSMEPTFKDKEQIIVEKVSVKHSDLQRGEIVVVKHPDNPKIFVIKRVIGLGGESFMIFNGKILIDGEQIDEKYLGSDVETSGSSYISEGEPLTVPESSFILLGDNRNNSSDSRLWGPVDKNSIVGRTFMVYYPLKNLRLVQ